MKKEKQDHATARKILQAAEQVFIAKGFDGSSINDIAEKANVHKSLIYHHFGNKKGLWIAVKSNLVEIHSGKEISQLDFPIDSFKSFLESVITFRFDFYNKNPAIARLVMWQCLEDDQEDIKGIGSERLNTVATQIKEFQKRGEIQQHLDPDMVSYIIMKTASLPFMETPAFFQGDNEPENKQKFLRMLINCLYLGLSVKR